MNSRSIRLAGSLKAGALLIYTLAATAMAQPRYSVNAVGYTDVNLGAGSNLVANPFIAEDDTVAHLFRGLPVGSFFLLWNPPAADFHPTNWFTEVGWTFPSARLNGPNGGFLWVPSPAKISFVGEVARNPICISHPRGEAFLNVVPGVGCLILCDNIIGPCPSDPPDGTTMSKWDSGAQSYETYLYLEGFGWIPDVPTLQPWESARFTVGQPYYIAGLPSGAGPAELVHLRAHRTGTNLIFHFAATNDCSFSILRSFALVTNRWELLRQQSVSATGGLASVIIPAETNKAAFYRLAPLFSLEGAQLRSGSRGSNRFQCEFYAPVTATYEFQRTLTLTNFSTASWQTIGSVNAVVSNVVTLIDNNATPSAAYYRLRY